MTTLSCSPNSIYTLKQPQFASIFRRLVTFKVDVREMRTEVNILAQFQHLETLEAYRLWFPNYHTDVDLPLVRPPHAQVDENQDRFGPVDGRTHLS